MPTAKPPRTKLTPKERAFVREFSVSRNKTQAAIKAGFPANSAKQRGYELAARPIVAAAIAAQEAKHAERLNITVDTLTDMFFSDRELAYGAKQAGAAVSATEKIGKLHGHLAERHRHGGDPDGIPIRIDTLTDDQLDKLIDRIAGKIGGVAAGPASGEEPEDED